jgi:hypothetical protein
MTLSGAHDPRATALGFVSAVWSSGSLLEAWTHSDPLFRLCTAQQWLNPLREKSLRDGFSPDDVVARLAAGDTAHPLWEPFESKLVSGFRQWGPLETFAVGLADRVEGMDLEVLHLYPQSEVVDGCIPPGKGSGVPILLRLSPKGWAVLNIGSLLTPEPGWPPRMR